MPSGKGIFRAVMEQPEQGLFRANFRGDVNPDVASADIVSQGPEILPDSHIGTSEADVRTFVENLARNRGYDRVVWETGRGVEKAGG
ncbi:MAG: hypothetical protein JOY70_02675 [Acidisphaera sp.]|nr:hypothetical protein [Acidisphaera sp.]MBV9814103.1 hypothetical protein [Acetobacteraceae bacterium]